MPKYILDSPTRLTTVRILILMEFIAILVSTSLAVVVEFLIYLTILSSRDLLKRVYAALKQPMVRMALVWTLVLVISCLYTIATREDLADILPSWRKLLLLPLAAAFFEDPKWKNHALHVFFYAICPLLVISSLTWLMDINFYKYRDGIVIANHASQGMTFAVFVIMALTLSQQYRGDRTKQIFFYVMALLAFSNIVFMTPGRSGYLALISILTIYTFLSISGPKKYFVVLGLIIVVGLTLAFSSLAKERIRLGISEMMNYQTSKEMTSMGVRMVVWKNSIKLLRQRPILGYGTAAFVQAYRTTIDEKGGWQDQIIEDPHNQFLRIQVENGLVGLIFFLFFIASFFFQAAPRRFRILGLSVLSAWCATSFFSSHFTTFFEGRFLFIWVGIFLSGGVFLASAESDNALSVER